MEFSAFVDLKVPDLAEEQMEAAFEHVNGVAELLGPIVGGGRDADVVGMQYDVEAKDPKEAIEIGLRHLRRGLGRKGKVVAVGAEPYREPAEEELVTKAEIARRLEISATRVGQLAQAKDFPKLATRRDARTALYRWGEVLRWQRSREDRIKRHGQRSRTASSRARSDKQRAAV